MSTQKERLFAFINVIGYSVREFERALGVSNGTIRHLKDTLSSNVKARVTTRFPQLNIDWLLTGYGDMLVSHDTVINNAIATDGSAASIHGNASVQQSSDQHLLDTIARLEAEVAELKAEKAKLYELLLKK